MIKLAKAVGILGLIGTLVLAYNAGAQEQPAETAGVPVLDEAMMAKMKEFGTPNENHKVLDQLVGNWDYTMKWWIAPDSEPQESTGTNNVQWVLGGRFIKQEVTGTAMGQPFEGQGLMGYDNQMKEYTAIWLDNMSTGIMQSKAVYDAATKTFTETGDFSCPIENGKKTFKGVVRIIDQNSYVYEMYMNDPEGKEFKSMEINYKRKG